jgi:HAD superfamily hydrolase (TIGR01484 family)
MDSKPSMDNKPMRPLSQLTQSQAISVRAVLTDIDDTLTEDGRLPAAAYAALEKLRAHGLVVVPVTGRPAGWCDLIARQWPIDAVVGENGAFYFRYDEQARRMIRVYAKTAAERAQDKKRLAIIEAEVLQAVPGAAVASDQAYREADLAIDFCEDVTPLSADAVRQIVAIYEKHGAVAKVSSIHVNGWFGGYDKLTTSRQCLRDCFGIDIDLARETVVYAGDSPNDAPMFAYFPLAVGVANVLDFESSIPAKPAFVTPSRGGAGFVELAERLLALRS